jgi:N-acetylmuramoyl-L-alanine amidase
MIKTVFFAIMIVYASTIYDRGIPHLEKLAVKNIIESIRCMELNIFHEARGESRSGMIAVGSVTLNRVKSGKFPITVCAVVYQSNQFSWSSASSSRRARVPDRIKILAYKLVMGEINDNTKGSLYFHNRDAENFNRRQTMTIGNHIFYS